MTCQQLKKIFFDLLLWDKTVVLRFRLDRSGAQLNSEARMRIRCVGRHYIFNRPFLLYMKKRDAKTPYFVMWVENAELLKKWKNDRKPQ